MQCWSEELSPSAGDWEARVCDKYLITLDNWPSGEKKSLTGGGGDVDVDADLGDGSAAQRRHAGVRPEVCELQVDDVQTGAAQRGRYRGKGWC